MRSIHAVLFDFDGTLAPNLDLPDMRRRVIEATRAQNVPEHVYEGRYIVEIIDAARTWLEEHDSGRAVRYYDEAHQIILDIELGAAAVTDPFPEVPAYLEDLKRRDIKLGVVTRNCRAAVLATYPDICNAVDVVHARDDVVHLKPDTRHLSRTLTALDTAPDQAAMIGDGQLDMRSGQALGMFCVGVLTGSSEREALVDAGANRVVARASDYDPG